jgi:hypothetical protein
MDTRPANSNLFAIGVVDINVAFASLRFEISLDIAA